MVLVGSGFIDIKKCFSKKVISGYGKEVCICNCYRKYVSNDLNYKVSSGYS